MGNYIYVGGELYHYGVKGMKWGVISKKVGGAVKKVKSYTKDERIRKSLKKEAVRNTRWREAYDKEHNVLGNKIAKATKTGDEVSKGTKKKIKQLKALEKHDEETKEGVQKSISDLKEHVNSMTEKYGKVPIQKCKTQIKNGEEYIKYLFKGDNDDYKFESRSTLDRDGNVQYEYDRMVSRTKHVPVPVGMLTFSPDQVTSVMGIAAAISSANLSRGGIDGLTGMARSLSSNPDAMNALSNLLGGPDLITTATNIANNLTPEDVNRINELLSTAQ